MQGNCLSAVGNYIAMPSSAVAIIAYRAEPDAGELASLRQCCATLGRHPLFLVCPASLPAGHYLEEAARAGARLEPVRFPDHWFQSVRTYNRLMLDSEFYERFSMVEYLLVYQLDAWVFSDALEEWCARGYSYVGAPFFNDRHELFPFVGNGGFSLRKIPDFIALLRGTLPMREYDRDFPEVRLPARTRLRGALKRLLHRAEMRLCRASSKWYCRLMWEHEDFIYAKAFSLLGRQHAPVPREAARFAFERCPELLFAWTGGKLPFGCHAHGKYGQSFWKQWIPPQ